MQVIITSDITFTIDTEDPELATNIAVQKLDSVDGIVDIRDINIEN